MNVKRLVILMTTTMLGLALISLWLWLLTGPPDTARAAPVFNQGEAPALASSPVHQDAASAVEAAPLATHTVCPSGCDYDTIQDAVDAAGDGDVIKVATGTYTGAQGRPAPAGYVGSSVITQVVYISKTVTIRGGYNTSFTEPPDPGANPTTLDAQGQGRVLFITGDISPTVEGLRITGGDATGLGGYYWLDDGGGIYIITATTTISNNQVFSNTAGLGGFGGGFSVITSTVTINNNQVFSNTAIFGSGLSLKWSDAKLTNNVIVDNQFVSGGSGLWILDSSVRLLHTTIARNDVVGGIGVLIGGYGSTVVLTNTILVSHTVGIVVGDGSMATLEGTLWGSGDWANGDDWWGDGMIVTGTVNLWGDPDFVDPDAGDYHIGTDSAAIDAGVDAGVIVDMDREPRPNDAGYDIGADEFYVYTPIAGIVAINNGPTMVGKTTTLTATVSAGNLIAYTWDFGDGETGVGAEVTHTYTSADVFTATVTAVNRISELTATTTVTITQPLFDIYLPLVMRDYPLGVSGNGFSLLQN